MKNKILFILVFLLFFIPFKINAYEEGISNYYIDMTVLENGNINVKELIILNGKFNGYERIINFINLRTADRYISFSGGQIYNPSGIKLKSIRNLDISGNRNFDLINNIGDEFKKVDSAKNGDYGVYTANVNSYNARYLIYNPSRGKEKGFYLEYELTDVAVLHKDLGEIYLNIFDKLREYVNVLEIHIHIPNNKNTIKGWAHGSLTGNIEIIDNENIKVTASKIKKSDVIDVRFVFDKNILKSPKKVTNINALNNIIEIENERAEKANLERLKIIKQLEDNTKKALLKAKKDPTRSNYENAYQLVNTLPDSQLKMELKNELESILKLVEAQENKLRKRAYTVFGGWFIGLILIIICIYIKYDKEYKREFKGKYYRDFPAEYGPEAVDYLIHKKVSNNTLSAVILNLVCKKVIIVEKIPDDKHEDYIFTKNNLKTNLTLVEQQALGLLFGNKDIIKLSQFKDKARDCYHTFLDDYNTWNDIATNFSRNEKFYENTNNKGWGIFYSLCGIIIGIYYARTYMNLLVILLVITTAIISLIYFICIKKRTKKGNEHYHKWIGLRNFLKDFSEFESRTLPDLVLWEKYLVYSIPLGCADKLVEVMKIRMPEINNGYTKDIGIYNFDYMFRLNKAINKSMRTSVNLAKTELKREKRYRASIYGNSSGNGFGGGFSSGSGSGGGFSSGGGSGGGGGGGGRF